MIVSTLGSPTLRAGSHVPHVNIRSGISTFARWRSVIKILSTKNTDIQVVTETGHDNMPSTLKWLTRNMQANELNEPDNHFKLTDHFKDSLSYNIYSTQGTSSELAWRRGRPGSQLHVPPYSRLTILPSTQTLDDRHHCYPRRAH